MSAPRKVAEAGPVLSELAELAETLTEAIAAGDVRGARQAHDALGQGLDSATQRPAAVVDLAQEREKRGPTRRAGRARRRSSAASAVREAAAQRSRTGSTEPNGGGA